jgi:hypothetical protein
VIITHLIGGLGNQMYQYAMGRHLAELNSTVLKLDVTGFEKYKHRVYGLSCFRIAEKFATVEEVRTLSKKRWFEKSKTFGNLKRRLRLKTVSSENLNLRNFIVKEKPFYYEPEILDMRGNIFLKGHWESYQYYEPIREILLKEFAIKYPQDDLNKRLSERILSTHSVGLHVRRGDKASEPSARRIHGACSVEYYNKAIEYVMQRVAGTEIYVFSDDMAWARKNIKAGAPVYFVDHNDASKDYEDLRLMSQCRHNIIANSSFSVWAAWLNTNKEKIVIGPKSFYTEDKQSKIEELITNPARRVQSMPEDWVKLPFIPY